MSYQEVGVGLQVHRGPSLGDQLTEREVSICKNVVNGFSNEEIGEFSDDKITTSTVKVHLRHIYKKLGINRRLELLRFFKPDLISPSTAEFKGNDVAILEFAGEGYTDEAIATKLGMRATEVRLAIARMRKEANIKTRVELAIWWKFKGELPTYALAN